MKRFNFMFSLALMILFLLPAAQPSSLFAFVRKGDHRIPLPRPLVPAAPTNLGISLAQHLSTGLSNPMDGQFQWHLP